jgi:hypothetical protein
VARLGDHRVAASRFRERTGLRRQRVEIRGFDFRVGELEPVRGRKPLGAQEPLQPKLVHRHGGTRNAGPRVRETRDLEEPLQGTILASGFGEDRS